MEPIEVLNSHRRFHRRTEGCLRETDTHQTRPANCNIPQIPCHRSTLTSASASRTNEFKLEFPSVQEPKSPWYSLILGVTVLLRITHCQLIFKKTGSVFFGLISTDKAGIIRLSHFICLSLDQASHRFLRKNSFTRIFCRIKETQTSRIILKN